MGLGEYLTVLVGRFMEIKVIKRNVVPNRITLYENDIGTKSLVFSVSRINDGVNLENLNGFLEIERDTGLTDRFILNKTIADDCIYFSIIVDVPLTLTADTLCAQISFENGNNTLIYKTKVFYIEVNYSVDGLESFSQLEPTVIKQLESKMLENIELCSSLAQNFHDTKEQINEQFNNDVKNAVQDLRTELSQGMSEVDGEMLICKQNYVSIKEEILVL